MSLIGLVDVSTAKHDYERLGYPTSRNIMNPDEFILTPQVYHDLHCLVSHPIQPLSPTPKPVLRAENGPRFVLESCDMHTDP